MKTKSKRAQAPVGDPIFCPKCGQGYTTLVCEHCIQEQSDIAVRAAQVEALRQLERNGGFVETRTIERDRHLRMFRCDLTFCGIEVKPWMHKGFFNWRTDKLDTVCSGCRIAVKSILEEALECPSV
jgi:hypothetical protein